MDRNAVWKWLILIVCVSASVALIVPPGKKIRFGLDLKGGTSFTVMIDEDQVRADAKSRGLTDEQVVEDVKKTMAGAQTRALEVIRNRVDNLGIAEPIIYPGKDNRIVVQLPGVGDEKRKEAEDSLKSLAFLEFRLVHEKNDDLVDALFDKSVAPEGYRIERVGSRSYYKREASYAQLSRDPEYRRRLLSFRAPAGFEFMLEKREEQGQTVFRPHLVKARRELSGDHLSDASVDYRAMGQPVVQLQFDSKGARKFSDVTSDYAPGGPKNPNPNNYRQLAIILDGTLYSAPVIREAIHGGKAEISGSFTVQEATFLSNILRAGSLPAPVKIVERRFVAPTLGADSIRSGIKALVIGSVCVAAFMAAYYLLCGIVADIALVLNMVLLPLGMVITAGLLSIFSKDTGGGGPIQLPVLTLPGIAGILLTVGMAVDANVLIYERMREEAQTGKRLWSTITAGYDRAFLAILDSNLTTILTGVILFVFGSGPIRGYAVTLCAGIIVSMYTALTVTKMLFALIAPRMKATSFRMMSMIRRTSIDFIALRKAAIAVSAAVIALTWIVMIVRGVRNPSSVFAVDFTGGSSVTLTFAKQVPIGEIRTALEGAGLRDVNPQYQREMEVGGTSYLTVTMGGENVGDEKASTVAESALLKRFPDAGFKVAQEDDVGALVGAELKKKAVWAIVISLVGMVIYLSFRFEMGFAVGAIVALVHDVLVTAGLYTLFGRQLNLTVVAALLTIVGYSVNDTIVIFDRIRENLKLMRKESFVEICNLSVNQTLGRTILTGLTVIVAVLILLVFGGGAVNDFALAMFIGCIAGMYSTVYVATPVVLAWHRNRKPDFAAKTT